MIASKRNQSILYMVELAVLTAIVVVLQLTGAAIKIPVLGTNVSLVLIPIALGAMVLGPAAGAWLGFVFGAITYFVGGVMGLDPFTNFLFVNHPVITALICFVKSTLAGFLAGWVYRLLQRRNEILAVFLAAILVPVVNTGVFVLGCFTIMDTINSFAITNQLMGPNDSTVYFIFIGLAGINFLLEFAVNVILAPALQRIIHIVSKRIRNR